MFLLSIKAGLRAGEISNLTWAMIVGPEGDVGDHIELHDLAAKKLSGRAIPLHVQLRAALVRLREQSGANPTFVITSERGERMQAGSVVNWFKQIYGSLGYEGASSHSGRRTFVTRAARAVFKCGGSLRDVQQLAGHRSIDQTQSYIEGDTPAKRRLVAMI
jgi:integrase/recombinase XerD